VTVVLRKYLSFVTAENACEGTCNKGNEWVIRIDDPTVHLAQSVCPYVHTFPGPGVGTLTKYQRARFQIKKKIVKIC